MTFKVKRPNPSIDIVDVNEGRTSNYPIFKNKQSDQPVMFSPPWSEFKGLSFWFQVHAFRTVTKREDLDTDSRLIWNTYLSPSAPNPIFDRCNLPQKVEELLKTIAVTIHIIGSYRNMFDGLLDYIYQSFFITLKDEDSSSKTFKNLDSSFFSLFGDLDLRIPSTGSNSCSSGDDDEKQEREFKRLSGDKSSDKSSEKLSSEKSSSEKGCSRRISSERSSEKVSPERSERLERLDKPLSAPSILEKISNSEKKDKSSVEKSYSERLERRVSASLPEKQSEKSQLENKKSSEKLEKVISVDKFITSGEKSVELFAPRVTSQRRRHEPPEAPTKDPNALNQLCCDLCTACWNNDLLTVKSLIQDCDIKFFINSFNNRGQTALYCAARQGSANIVSELITVIDIDLDIQQLNHLGTALHASCFFSHHNSSDEICAMLIYAGASLDLKNSHGCLPQQEAISKPIMAIFDIVAKDGIEGIKKVYPNVKKKGKPPRYSPRSSLKLTSSKITSNRTGKKKDGNIRSAANSASDLFSSDLFCELETYKNYEITMKLKNDSGARDSSSLFLSPAPSQIFSAPWTKFNEAFELESENEDFDYDGYKIDYYADLYKTEIYLHSIEHTNWVGKKTCDDQDFYSGDSEYAIVSVYKELNFQNWVFIVNSVKGFFKVVKPKTEVTVIEDYLNEHFNEFFPDIKANEEIRETKFVFQQFKSEPFMRDLMELENGINRKSISVGVVCLLPGQTSPVEYFKNSEKNLTASAKEFLRLMELEDSNSEAQVTKKWFGRSVRFDLAYKMKSEQIRSVIANEVVVILFIEEGEKFNPVNSAEFGIVTQVFVLVRPFGNFYKVGVFRRVKVESFRPENTNYVVSADDLCDYVSTIVHNGTAKSFMCMPISTVIEKPRKKDISELVEKHSLLSNKKKLLLKKTS